MKIILLIALLLTNMAWAKKKEKPQPINYLNLSAKLVKDRHYDRALSTLKKVDVKVKDFDFRRFYTLKALSLLNLKQKELSKLYFEAAIELGEDKPSIYIYLAQINWEIKEYQATIDALDKAGELAKKENLYVIKAECYKHLGEVAKAWEVLDEAIATFENPTLFYKQKFYYLVEYEFYVSALQYANLYLERKQYERDDYILVAMSLINNKEFEKAAVLLEEAYLLYPLDEQIIKLLAQTYIQRERFYSAAMIYDKASIYYPEFALNAARLYLKSDNPIRALELNYRTVQQKEKFISRTAINVALNDYEALAALESPLKRYDILEDENIRYALGYSYFRLGEFDRAKFHLKKLTSNALFRKATKLYSLMDECESDVFKCQ